MDANHSDPPTEDGPAFDAQEALAHVDHDLELLEEITELFVEDSPELLNRIASAVDSGDAEALWNSAHALKGALGNFAATASVSIAEELETMGREGRLDGARRLKDQLLHEIGRFQSELQAFLDSRS